MSILFYTAADQDYEMFAPLYIYFALKNNPNSYVEIGVEDANSYINENKVQIDILERMFGDRFKFTTVDFDGKLPGAVRFITEPEMADHCDYVYIGDIDIILLDNDIESKHKQNMRENKESFSNIIRKPSDTEDKKYRLSGLHFAPIDLQYPLPDLDDIDTSDNNSIYGADEHVLYQIMEKNGEMISRDLSFRPEHGIHLRTNNHPFGQTKGLGKPKISFDEIKKGKQTTPWSGIEEPYYRTKFLQELGNEDFQDLYVTFDIRLRNILLVLENICKERFSEFEHEALTYIIAESYYETLVRKAFRTLESEGLVSTLYKTARYLG